MTLKNSPERFGLLAMILHWLSALAVFGLFGLGWWMTDLTYYDNLYKVAPWWHKSFGFALFLIIILRLLWRMVSPPPKPLNTHKSWEIKAAHLAHGGIYLFLFIIMFSGYLISTEDGRAIEVFGLFSIPAIITNIPNQADNAGLVHLYAACSLIGLVVLHALAAFKHHFIDKDRTLLRMLGR